jgi:ribosomal protein L11 methylase PrmA
VHSQEGLIRKMRVSLSKRKHLPVLKPNNCNFSFPFWKFGKIRSLERSRLEYNSSSAYIWVMESFEDYLPPFSLRDKVVLDLGACCGETAYFFLKHGAGKVVCVEYDPECVRMLNDNKKNLDLNIDIIPERFSLKHLGVLHDFIKCDIEGDEVDLLPVAGSLKPCVLEVHSVYLARLFENKGFHVFKRSSKNNFIMTNYIRK